MPETLIRNAAWAVVWDAAVKSHVHARGVDIRLAGGKVAAIAPHDPAATAEAAGILAESQAKMLRDASLQGYLGRDGNAISPLSLRMLWPRSVRPRERCCRQHLQPWRLICGQRPVQPPSNARRELLGTGPQTCRQRRRTPRCQGRCGLDQKEFRA